MNKGKETKENENQPRLKKLNLHVILICNRCMFMSDEQISPSSQAKIWNWKFVKFYTNHNYNKILKSDWLSTVLISALIGHC